MISATRLHNHQQPKLNNTGRSPRLSWIAEGHSPRGLTIFVLHAQSRDAEKPLARGWRSVAAASRSIQRPTAERLRADRRRPRRRPLKLVLYLRSGEQDPAAVKRAIGQTPPRHAFGVHFASIKSCPPRSPLKSNPSALPVTPFRPLPSAQPSAAAPRCSRPC